MACIKTNLTCFVKIKCLRNIVFGLKCNNVIAFDIVKAANCYKRKRSALLSWKEVLFYSLFV